MWYRPTRERQLRTIAHIRIIRTRAHVKPLAQESPKMEANYRIFGILAVGATSHTSPRRATTLRAAHERCAGEMQTQDLSLEGEFRVSFVSTKTSLALCPRMLIASRFLRLNRNLIKVTTDKRIIKLVLSSYS